MLFQVSSLSKNIFCFHLESYQSNGASPLLKRLYQLLLTEYERKEPRCIIFVETRYIAQTLCGCLKEQEDLTKFNINPEYLTGANASGNAGGKNKKFKISHSVLLFK